MTAKWNYNLKMYTVFFVLLSFVVGANTKASQESEKNRNRVEELFVWKVSDELKLSSDEELEFSKIMKEIREERVRAEKQRDEALKKAESKDTKTQALGEYRDALKAMSLCQTKELDLLEKLLGPQKLADYLLLKEKLMAKLKGALGKGRTK